MVTAKDIISVLVAASQDKIWASELNFAGTDTRIDFWTMEPIKSASFRATSYEVKISRQDYKRDSDEKQHGALTFSDRFFYVTPPDLLTLAELPPWAGLLECDGKKLSVKRKAPLRQKASPDWKFVVDLVRASGRIRRDTNLMQGEISLLRSQLSHLRAQDERNQLYKTNEFIRRFSAKANSRATP